MLNQITVVGFTGITAWCYLYYQTRIQFSYSCSIIDTVPRWIICGSLHGWLLQKVYISIINWHDQNA